MFSEALCPKCGNEKTRIIDMTFPKRFVCIICGLEFLKFPNCLVDE